MRRSTLLAEDRNSAHCKVVVRPSPEMEQAPRHWMQILAAARSRVSPFLRLFSGSSLKWCGRDATCFRKCKKKLRRGRVPCPRLYGLFTPKLQSQRAFVDTGWKTSPVVFLRCTISTVQINVRWPTQGAQRGYSIQSQHNKPWCEKAFSAFSRRGKVPKFGHKDKFLLPLRRLHDQWSVNVLLTRQNQV